MTTSINDDLKKQIKKNIHAKAQIAKIIFPPGFGETALYEAETILNDLWFSKKYTGKLYLLKNEIQVRPVYLTAITELLLRNHCFSDIRLVIYKDTSVGKKSFEKKCQHILWDYYVNKSMSLKIKVSSISSTAFHETGLKEIITDIIKPYVKEIFTGEDTHETTCLHVELYKNKLTISISLAGHLLYKRGYRGELSSSAPLREDIAACCIQNAFLFAKKYYSDFTPNTLLIPFSGTGTFAFEFIQTQFKLNPALRLRHYALEKMPFFKKDFFLSLLKKSQQDAIQSNKEHDLHLYCIDNSQKANHALQNNLDRFKNKAEIIHFTLPTITQIQDDFFNIQFDELKGDIFVMINPPYGIRLDKNSNPTLLYKKIASKLNTISLFIKKKQRNILGFILCPNQETWSVFIRELKQVKNETYHFTQGGLDIRLCQFFI